tara:strand:+ start:404 stop:1075 length:672 start_codon:yes stop_codon:yes gene_type:complete
MNDYAGQYRLLSWLSPSYPVGAFSYSHGLEFAVETGTVSDRASLISWLKTVLIHGTGRIDGVLFREAHVATRAEDWVRLKDIAEFGNAFQPTPEFALESRAQGAAFVRVTRSAWPSPALNEIDEDVVYPIAVAVSCAGHDISCKGGLQGYFHAFMGNLVSAAVRLIPLGQTDGQQAVAALEDTVRQAVSQGMEIPFDDIGSAAPLIDLASIQHETQYTRLFRS